MNNLETIKNKSKESITNLVARGKEQPEEVKTWGVTAAAGIAGALAITAVAKGILAVVATVANPPVALTVGTLGGGALGWGFMQKQGHAGESMDETEGGIGSFVTDVERTVPAVVNSASEGSGIEETTEASNRTGTVATDSGVHSE